MYKFEQFKKQKAGHDFSQPALNVVAQTYFTEATRPLKVSGLFMARSASTLRSSSIPFF
jgi:hypothetical protein